MNGLRPRRSQDEFAFLIRAKRTCTLPIFGRKEVGTSKQLRILELERAVEDLELPAALDMGVTRWEQILEELRALRDRIEEDRRRFCS